MYSIIIEIFENVGKKKKNDIDIEDPRNRYYNGPKNIVKLSKQHNNSNILSLGARFLAIEEAMETIRLWLDTDFEGDRHQRRIKKLDK